MSEKKIEEKKVEETKSNDTKYEKLFTALEESREQIKILTEELSKVKNTVEAVPRLEALEDFKQLNGREDRFKEIIKLADIDVTDKKTRKDAMIKALEKYPEFRKTKEAGFAKGEAKINITKRKTPLDDTLSVLGY